MIRPMIAFDIEARTPVLSLPPGMILTAAVVYPLVKVLLQRCHFIGCQHALHYQKTLLMKLVNLPLLDHVLLLFNKASGQ